LSDANSELQASLTRIQDVVAKHLKQVAAKKTFDVEWSVAG